MKISAADLPSLWAFADDIIDVFRFWIIEEAPMRYVALSALFVLSSFATVDTANGATIDEWEQHDGQGVIELETMSRRHGAAAEFEYAEIPGDDDEAWGLTPDVESPDFEAKSALCETELACREGVDFRYFQTILTVEDDEKVKDFRINIGYFDDGVRVTVFNSKFPEGHTSRQAFLQPSEDGGETGNLARLLMSGEENRIVVTHVDDCCGFAVMRDLEINLDTAPTRRR